jgi:hypothetical protein
MVYQKVTMRYPSPGRLKRAEAFMKYWHSRKSWLSNTACWPMMATGANSPETQPERCLLNTP